jgi:hypothetical protein
MKLKKRCISENNEIQRFEFGEGEYLLDADEIACNLTVLLNKLPNFQHWKLK